MTCAVLVPEGKIAMGKLARPSPTAPSSLQVDGNFDDCLDVARELAEHYPVELVNSVNPDRIEGQKTAAFEVVDALGDAPDFHSPGRQRRQHHRLLGGYREYRDAAPPRPAPRSLRGCGASRPPARRRSSSATRSTDPETIATAIRIGNPASWEQADRGPRRVRRHYRRGHRRADPRGPPLLSARRASSSSPARRPRSPACSGARRRGRSPPGATIVCTVTGHGLKDPQWALRTADGSDVVPTKVEYDLVRVATHFLIA